MESGGGTQLWCFKCQDIQECKVLWYANDFKGNFFHQDYPDLRWRQRPRECNKCGTHFDTYEVNESVIDELVELRKLISHIKVIIDKQQSVPREKAK